MSRPAPPLSRSDSVRYRLAERKAARQVGLKKRASKRSLLGELRESGVPGAKGGDSGADTSTNFTNEETKSSSGASRSPRPPQSGPTGRPSPRRIIEKGKAAGGSKLAPGTGQSSKKSTSNVLAKIGQRVAVLDKDIAQTSWSEAMASGPDGSFAAASGEQDLQRELERQLALGLTTVDREFRRQAAALDASLTRNRASRRARHDAKERLARYQRELEEVEGRARSRVAREFAAAGSGGESDAPAGSGTGATHDTQRSMDTVGSRPPVGLEQEDDASASVSSTSARGRATASGSVSWGTDKAGTRAGFSPRRGPMSPSILDRTRSRAGSTLSETAQSTIDEKTKVKVQPGLEARRLKATYVAGLAVTEHAHEQEALKQRLSLEDRLKRRNARRARRREQAERRRRQKEQEAAGVMRSSIAGKKSTGGSAGGAPSPIPEPAMRGQGKGEGSAAPGAGEIDAKSSSSAASPFPNSFANGGGQEVPAVPSELEMMTRGRSDSVLRRGYYASARARTIEDIMQGKLTNEEQRLRMARIAEVQRRRQLHQSNMELKTLAGASAALARVSVQLSKLRHRRDDVRKEHPSKRNPAPCPAFEIANRAAMAEDRAERDALNRLAQHGPEAGGKAAPSGERKSGASTTSAVSAATAMRATRVSQVVTRDRVESQATENRPMEDLMARLRQERGSAGAIARSASESLAAHKQARKAGREAALEVIRAAEEDGQGLVEGSHPAVVLSLERQIQLLIARVDAAEAAVDAAEMVQAQLFEKDSDQGTEWSDDDDDIDLVMATVQLAEEEAGVNAGMSALGFGGGGSGTAGAASGGGSSGSVDGASLSTGGASGSKTLLHTRSIEKMTGLAGGGALDKALQQEFMAAVPPAIDAVSRAEVLYNRLQLRIELLRTAQTMSLCRRRLVTQFYRYDRLKEAGATAVTALNTAARSVVTAEDPERELARAVLEAQQDADTEAEYKSEKAVVNAEHSQHKGSHLGQPPPGESPVGLGEDAARAAIVPDVTKAEKEALERLKRALEKALEDVFEAEEAVTAHAEEVEGRRTDLFLELQRLKTDADTADEKVNRAARDIERATVAFDEAEKAGLLPAVGRARGGGAAVGGGRLRATSDAPDRDKIREALTAPGKWKERVAQAAKDIAAARQAKAVAAEAHFVAVLAAEGRRPGAAAAAAEAEARRAPRGRVSTAISAPGGGGSSPSPPRRRRGRRASVIAFVPMTERKSRLYEFYEAVEALRKLSADCEQWSKASAEVLRMLREGARSKAQAMRSTEQGAVVRLDQCDSRLIMVREEVEADSFDVFQPGTAAAGRMEAALEVATEAVREAKRARTKVRRPGMGKKQRAREQEQEIRKRVEQARAKDRFGLRAGLAAGLADRQSSSGKLIRGGGGSAAAASESQPTAGVRRGLQPPPSGDSAGAVVPSGGGSARQAASGAGADGVPGDDADLDPAVEAALASAGGGILSAVDESDEEDSEGGSSDDDDDFDPVAAALRKRRVSKRRASQAAQGRRRSLATDAVSAVRSKGGSDMEAATAAAKALAESGLSEAERKELEADLVEVEGEDPISSKGLNVFVLAVATAVAQVSDAAALRRYILEESRKRRRLRNATKAAQQGGGVAETGAKGGADAAGASARFAALIDVERSELPRIEYAKGHRSLAVALVDPSMQRNGGRGGSGGLGGGGGAVAGGWSRSIDALVESRLLIEGAGSTLVGADGRPRGLVAGKVDSYVYEYRAGGQLGLRRDFMEVLARLKAVTLRYNAQIDSVRSSGLTKVRGVAGRKMLDSIQLANASLGAADAMLPAASEMVRLRVTPKRVQALESMTRKSGIRVVRFEVVFNETMLDRDREKSKLREREEMLQRERKLLQKRKEEQQRQAEEAEKRRIAEEKAALSRSGTAAQADMEAAASAALADMKKKREARVQQEEAREAARKQRLARDEDELRKYAEARIRRYQQEQRAEMQPLHVRSPSGRDGASSGIESSPIAYQRPLQGGVALPAEGRGDRWPAVSPMAGGKAVRKGSGGDVELSLDPATASPRGEPRGGYAPATDRRRNYASGGGSSLGSSSREGMAKKAVAAFSFGSSATGGQGGIEGGQSRRPGPMSPLMAGGQASLGQPSQGVAMPAGLQHTQSFIDPRTGQQMAYVMYPQQQQAVMMVPAGSPMGGGMMVAQPGMMMAYPGMVAYPGMMAYPGMVARPMMMAYPGMMPGAVAYQRWRSLRHVMSAAGGLGAGMSPGRIGAPSGGPMLGSPRAVMQAEQRSVGSGRSGGPMSPRRRYHGTSPRGGTPQGSSPRGNRRGGGGSGMEVSGYIGDRGGRGGRGSGGDSGDRRSRLAASAQHVVSGRPSPRSTQVPASSKRGKGEREGRIRRGR